MPSPFFIWGSNKGSSVVTDSKTNITFQQPREKVGLLVTDELQKAIDECKSQVARIVADCKAKNRKFRDVEFDLKDNKYSCLFGINLPKELGQQNVPASVQRVSQLFDKPSFFRPSNEACASDVHQGLLGNCWFLSALATVSSMKGLVEQLCVARDEKVGVYGFIFFREGTWVPVIVDDFLFTSMPKWEELPADFQSLYQDKKENYESLARKGGRGFFFARCGGEEEQREIWVPLIEKAYAKLHGDYASLDGGQAGEGIEDLTGGVSGLIAVADIFDTDKFWKEELLKVNKDRLFGCSMFLQSGQEDGYDTSFGLVEAHTYSILKCVEVKNKRFIVLRNPWGYSRSEWNGPWSDGSKEWTQEWLEVLPEIGHTFSRTDGQFIMEYSDFLEIWDYIDRTVLFDSTWVMSSHTLCVHARPEFSAYSWGDVAYSIELPEASPAVVVLSETDTRYFKGLTGRYWWFFDFSLFKKGDSNPISRSIRRTPEVRSVHLEISNLSEGEYFVHVRTGRVKDPRHVPVEPHNEERYQWFLRPGKFSQVLAERAKSHSLASNFDIEKEIDYLPIPQDAIAGSSLVDLTVKAKEADDRVKQEDSTTAVDIASSHIVEKMITVDTHTGEVNVVPAVAPSSNHEKVSESSSDDGNTEKEAENDKDDDIEEDQIYLGLRVYTKKNAVANIQGHLRRQNQSFKNLAKEEKWPAKV